MKKTVVVKKISLPALKRNRLVFHLRCPECGRDFKADYYGPDFDGRLCRCPHCLARLELTEDSARLALDKQARRIFARLAAGGQPDLSGAGEMLARAVLLLRPLLVVLLVGFYSEHIGHIILFPANFLARLSQVSQRRPLMFAFHSDPSKVTNRHINKQWSRAFIFTEAARAAYDLLRLRQDMSNDNSLFGWPEGVWGGLASDDCYFSPLDRLPLPKRTNHLIDLRDRYWTFNCDGALKDFPPPFSFTEDEHRAAQSWLKERNVRPEKGFVCILGRDGLHHDVMRPEQKKMWRSIDFRNVDIDTYLPAMRWLAGRGVASFRMGMMTRYPLQTQAEDRLITDYASLKRSEFLEFMDIYMGANCLFYVTCGTGPDPVPLLMRKPLLVANFPYISLMGYNCAPALVCLAMKKMWRESEKRYLSFREMLALKLDGLYCQTHLDEAGLTLVDHSPEELTAYISEMYARVTGAWEENAEERAMRRDALSILHEFHPGYPFEATFIYDYLKNNQYLLN